MSQVREIHVVNVFCAGPNGGNPAPIIIDAAGMSDADMQSVARTYGLESGFVWPAPEGSDCDLALRFWVPNHEMTMCGHATLGAVWLLHSLGKLPRDDAAIWTPSGRVDARVSRRDSVGVTVEITQPRGKILLLPDASRSEAEILKILGVTSKDLAGWPIQNAYTSRVKTLVPLRSVAVLDGLRPDFSKLERLCERIGSTGLYPYAASDLTNRIFEARQFPKSSGYPEDAATGIAAAALAFGLLESKLIAASERPLTIRQGRAMGRPSEISVRFRFHDGRPDGCWLGGSVHKA